MGHYGYEKKNSNLLTRIDLRSTVLQVATRPLIHGYEIRKKFYLTSLSTYFKFPRLREKTSNLLMATKPISRGFERRKKCFI